MNEAAGDAPDARDAELSQLRARVAELLPLQARVSALEARIAQQAQTEAELRRSERRLEWIMQQAPDYIVGIDGTGRITYISRTVAPHRRQDAIGLPVETWMEPQYHAGFREALRVALATGQVSSYESRSTLTGRYYVNRIAPVLEAVDVVADRAILITHDITEQKATELRLRESEARFRTLVTGSFEGLTISVDGKIIETNQAFAELSGYAREEVIGKTVLDLATPESAALALAQIRKGIETPYEVVGVRRDGTTFACEILGRNLLHHGQPARITAFRDISARKREEAERKLLEERMLSAQKLEHLGVLAGGVAHDFNNLLLVVLGHAELALSNGPVPLLREHLLHIHTAAERASELTKQLLTYAGRSPTSVETLDLGALVRDMSELLKVTVSKKARIELVLDVQTPAIEADPGQLRQIVMNLIKNAADALGDVGGEIHLRTSRATLTASELQSAAVDATAGPGEYVVLQVSDTGVGMDAATLARIFDPFFTTKFTGRGLGLASVLGIVRSHRGAIHVRSELGAGTVFTLYFSPSARVPVVVPQRPKSERPVYRAQGLALVVDDEPMIRALTTEILRSVGFEVVMAGDGAEALQVFGKHHGEIVIALLDLTMPRMDGLETLAALRALRPQLPALLLSGFHERVCAPDDRITAFISKPFEIDWLLERVREVLLATD